MFVSSITTLQVEVIGFLKRGSAVPKQMSQQLVLRVPFSKADTRDTQVCPNSLK